MNVQGEWTRSAPTAAGKERNAVVAVHCYPAITSNWDLVRSHGTKLQGHGWRPRVMWHLNCFNHYCCTSVLWLSLLPYGTICSKTKDELRIMEDQLQNNTLHSYVEEERFWIQEHHWLRYWATSPFIPNNQFRGYRGPPLGSLIGFPGASALIKVVTPFAVSPTVHLEPSCNLCLPRKTASSCGHAQNFSKSLWPITIHCFSTTCLNHRCNGGDIFHGH